MSRVSHKKVALTRRSQNVIEYDEQDSLKESHRPQFVVPDEILIMVFSYLPLQDRSRLSLVNKQWQRCAFLILHNLVISLRGLLNSIKMSVNDGLSFNDLQIKGRTQVTATLERFRGCKIERVEFQLFNNSFNEELLCSMTEIAKRAKTVDVKYNIQRFNMMELNDDSYDLVHHTPILSDFFSLCKVLGPYIRQLHFSTEVDTTEISAERFHDILANLKNLKAIGFQTLSLLLPFQGKVPEDCFPELEKADIWDLHYDCPIMRTSWRGFVDRFQNQLKTLSIFAKEWMVSDQEDDVLLDIRHFVHLEYLSLYHTTWSNYKLRQFVPLLCELATACPRLTTLHLRWRWKLGSTNSIKWLFYGIHKIKQIQTVNLYLDFRLPHRVEELSILRMLRKVAHAKRLRRDLKIVHVDFSDWYPVLRISGSMGLTLADNASRQCIQIEQRIDFPKRCETFYI